MNSIGICTGFKFKIRTATIAYIRTVRIRMFFMALGFRILALAELYMLLAATGNLHDAMLPKCRIASPQRGVLELTSVSKFHIAGQ